MRYFGLCLLGILLAAALFAAPSRAGEAAPTSAPLFAVVDMEKVFDGYEAYKAANQEFRSYFMEVERQLEMNRRLRLLEDGEAQEIKDLRAAVALSPEKKMRLQQLEALSDAREQELMALDQKGTSLTPEEQARKEYLTATAGKRAAQVAAEEKRLTEARQKRNEEISAPFNQTMKNALEKVAKQNRVSVIFNKEVVLWTPLDLTDAVLAELNKPPKKAAK